MSKSKKNAKKTPFLFEEILNLFRAHPSKVLNYKQVSAQLNIQDQATRVLVNALLDEIKHKGLLLEPEKGKFKLKETEQFITGVVDMTNSGAAYIITDELSHDVYVSARNTLNAMHKDVVKVRLLPKRSGSQTRDGVIVEVLQRNKLDLVGILHVSGNFAFLVPDNQKIKNDVYIPQEKFNGALHGQKVIVRITEWPKNAVSPIGEVSRVLGNPQDNNVEMHAILAEYGLPYDFPKEVEEIANRIDTRILADEIAKRRDFRDILTFTIDPFDAKDFDDALSFKRLENGNIEIGVHIADVSHYVKPNSVLDQEAYSRATSVYLVDRVVPMLPEILSNNVCSLRPNEDKLCFSAVFELDQDAQIHQEWFGRTVIHSDRRFTYEEVQTILEQKEGELSEELLLLDRLAKKIREERFRKGSINFDKLEVKFHLDEKGDPIGVFFKQQKDSNQLIEDFMLLANRRVATFINKSVVTENEDAKKKSKKSQRPFVYRVHDKPNPDKVQQFAEFIARFGYRLNYRSEQQIASSMNQLMKDVNGKKEANTIELLAIRTMAKAIYTTKNIGHYGLGFEFYTHFTSPIRRYPDVMVHRLLQDYLDQQAGKQIKMPELESLEVHCKHSSEMEKLAADAERASIKYKQVQFLSDKIGQQYKGVISGVTEWGMFVEIIENKCEGMIRIRDMADDFYYYDEDNYCLRGKRTGKVYTFGDTVEIIVRRADLAKKQLDFELVLAPKKSTKPQPKSKKTDTDNYDFDWEK